MAAVTICSDFGAPQKIKSDTVSPSISYEVMGPDTMILVFCVSSFKPTFSLSSFTFMHWRRKWQPTQCSCLENPRDGGAWWAAVYGVEQSRTRLKQLSSSSMTKKSLAGILVEIVFST